MQFLVSFWVHPISLHCFFKFQYVVFVLTFGSHCTFEKFQQQLVVASRSGMCATGSCLNLSGQAISEGHWEASQMQVWKCPGWFRCQNIPEDEWFHEVRNSKFLMVLISHDTQFVAWHRHYDDGMLTCILVATRLMRAQMSQAFRQQTSIMKTKFLFECVNFWKWLVLESNLVLGLRFWWSSSVFLYVWSSEAVILF